MKSIRAFLLCLAVLATHAAAATRILCLGDSITEGGSTFKVYRPYLAEELRAAGIDAVFTGPKKDRDGLAHGGYGGRSIEQVLEEYKKWHAQYPADVVILHSGHNHFVEEKPIPGILKAAEEIVAIARKDNPDAIVLLARVIPSGKLPKYEYIPELNQRIGELGAKLNVTVVDQAAGFDWKTDTIGDKVHPSESGAKKMAAKFFAALQPLLAASKAPLNPMFSSLPDTQHEALAMASKKVTYKTVDGLALEMHLFLPEEPASGKRPAVLFIHGGGWGGGDPSVHAFESLHLSKRGMVAASIRYRLLGDPAKNPVATARSPGDCLADSKSAMRWLRSHAAGFDIDPDRIAAGGGSAGGHLAAALNTIPGYDDPADDLDISPEADALVLLYPAFDLTGGWGGGISRCRKAGIDPATFSPATLAGKGFPPTVILVGRQDPVSPPASNAAFLARMKDAGAQVDLFTYDGKEHKLFERRKTDPHFQSYLIQADRFFQDLGWIEKRGLPPLPDVAHTHASTR